MYKICASVFALICVLAAAAAVEFIVYLYVVCFDVASFFWESFRNVISALLLVACSRVSIAHFIYFFSIQYVELMISDVISLQNLSVQIKFSVREDVRA